MMMIQITDDPVTENINVIYTLEFDQLHPQKRLDMLQDAMYQLSLKFAQIDKVYE